MTVEEEATLDWIEGEIRRVRREVVEGNPRKSLINEWKRWLFLWALMLRPE